MKISELITQLSIKINVWGDQEIKVNDYFDLKIGFNIQDHLANIETVCPITDIQFCRGALITAEPLTAIAEQEQELKETIPF